MRHGVSWILVFAALAVNAGSSGVAWALDHSGVADLIQTAKTAADHEAIATHFEEMAAEAKESAERHQKMGAAYTNNLPPNQKSTTSSLNRTMPPHCKSLVKQYQAAAAEYLAMAKVHRAMAKHAASK